MLFSSIREDCGRLPWPKTADYLLLRYYIPLRLHAPNPWGKENLSNSIHRQSSKGKAYQLLFVFRLSCCIIFSVLQQQADSILMMYSENIFRELRSHKVYEQKDAIQRELVQKQFSDSKEVNRQRTIVAWHQKG